MSYNFEVTAQNITFLFTSLQLINRVHKTPFKVTTSDSKERNLVNFINKPQKQTHQHLLLYVPEKGTENCKFNVFYNTLSQTFQSISFCNQNKKLNLSYLNAEVLYSLVGCPDNAKDVLKRFSTPNYMDFGPNGLFYNSDLRF